MKWKFYDSETEENYKYWFSSKAVEDIEDIANNVLENYLSQQEADFLQDIHSHLGCLHEYEPRKLKEKLPHYQNDMENFLISEMGYHHSNGDEVLKDAFERYDELFDLDTPYSQVNDAVAKKFEQINERFFTALFDELDKVAKEYPDLSEDELLEKRAYKICDFGDSVKDIDDNDRVPMEQRVYKEAVKKAVSSFDAVFDEMMENDWQQIKKPYNINIAYDKADEAPFYSIGVSEAGEVARWGYRDYENNFLYAPGDIDRLQATIDVISLDLEVVRRIDDNYVADILAVDDGKRALVQISSQDDYPHILHSFECDIDIVRRDDLNELDRELKEFANERLRAELSSQVATEMTNKSARHRS